MTRYITQRYLNIYHKRRKGQVLKDATLQEKGMRFSFLVALANFLTKHTHLTLKSYSLLNYLITLDYTEVWAKVKANSTITSTKTF